MECQFYSTIEYYTSIIVNLLSLIGSVLVVFFILKKKLFKSYSFKILLYISINDLVRASVGLTLRPFIGTNLICLISAYTIYLANISNLVWAFCLSATLYQIIALEETNFEEYHILWLFNAYVVGGVIEALPFITDSYGFAENTCQLKVDTWGEIWRFVVYYCPFVVAIVPMVFFYVKIYQKLKIIKNSMIKVIFGRGFIYAIFIEVLYVPLLAIRITELFVWNCTTKYAILVIYMISLLQGFANALVFFFNKTVRESIKSIEESSNQSDDMTNSSLLISFESPFSNDTKLTERRSLENK